MAELFSLIFKLDFKNIFINPTENKFIKFFRYAFVGGIAFVVDYLIFVIFSLMLGDSDFSLNVSTIAGFIGGLITNFVLSKKLVFTENARVNSSLEFLAYGIIGLVGCGLNVLLINIFVNIITLNKYISKVVVALIVLFYNYIARKIILYK